METVLPQISQTLRQHSYSYIFLSSTMWKKHADAEPHQQIGPQLSRTKGLVSGPSEQLPAGLWRVLPQRWTPKYTSVLISVLSQSELPWVLHDIFQGPSTKLRNQTWIALASRMTASVSIQTFTKKNKGWWIAPTKRNVWILKVHISSNLAGLVSITSAVTVCNNEVISATGQKSPPRGSCSPTLQRFTCGRADWKSGVGSRASAGNSAASAKQPDSSNLCIYHG